MNLDQKHYLVKKLLYQSSNRGCKETDLILGNFARANIDNMSEQDLLEFEKILMQNDADIYDWCTGKTSISKIVSSKMIESIVSFHKKWNI